MAEAANLAFVLLFLLAVRIEGRSLGLKYGVELLSDGVDDDFQEKESSFIALKGTASSSEGCEQMYGFLPCSSSPAGHLFLIVVYEYLLVRGESLIASGGDRIFKILGPGVFGASAFHVLGFLPEALILLASGLLNSREIAQEYVFTGVGLLAGSTILLLTIVWGTCVVVGSLDSSNNITHNPSASSNKRRNHLERLLSHYKGYGLVTDTETTYTARIMLLSVIPFLVIQIPRAFHQSSSVELIFIIISLFLSVVFLLIYFFYQIFQPWIQKRRLEYVKHEHLVLDILQHMQNQTVGRLLTDDGAPNVPAIRRLFEETDRDQDNFISISELKEIIHEIQFSKLHSDKDEATEKMMNEFDVDSDKKITMDEFVNGVMKWLDETKNSLDKRYHSIRSLKQLHEVLQPWIQKKREEREMMKYLISEILQHVQSTAIGNLMREDGTPDTTAIRRLFENIDHDKDNLISFSEMKELLTNIKFGPTHVHVDEAVARIMEELDLSGDQMLNEEEFVTGLSTWLHKTSKQSKNLQEDEDDFYQKTWEQTDKLLEENCIDRSPLAWTKAILRLLLGIVILGLLAEPLIDSVHYFSNYANVPSFFVSFILVPLATNARIAILAINEARRKKPRTTSLTFSEIYGGVFMNNMLGFSVLLSLICFRGLTWDFSAEVLIVLIVCAIMGYIASFSSIIPIWASFLAYLLYPLSLILVYFLDDFHWLS